MNKFWKWIQNKAPGPDDEPEERVLYLNGVIAEDSWWEDDVTPDLFKDELNSGSGDIVLWINSPGGDCFAAAEIYNMLRDYAGKVTVKIDGIAASAASVIAMAGDEVLVSPVSMMMIHNPATVAMGDHNEMQKAADILDQVKESIINAYELKTGLPRKDLSKLMEAETWMDANKAIELKFADSVIERRDFYRNPEEPEEEPEEGEEQTDPEKEDPEEERLPIPLKQSMLFKQKQLDMAVTNKVIASCKKDTSKVKNHKPEGRSVKDCRARLALIKNFM